MSAVYLEQAGLVAAPEGGLPQAPTDQLAVVEADETVHVTHVLLPLVHLLRRLQVHKHPASGQRRLNNIAPALVGKEVPIMRCEDFLCHAAFP